MPCLPCRSTMMGLVALSGRSGGPSSDVPVHLSFKPGSGQSVASAPPEGFLSPRLCMLCGCIFCPPIVDQPESGKQEGSRSKPGTESELEPGTFLLPALRRRPAAIAVEFRPNTAMAVLRLLEDRCQVGRGVGDDAVMDEARGLFAVAVRLWKDLHGED